MDKRQYDDTDRMAVKQKNPLSVVVQEYGVTLKRRGGSKEYIGCCPFHSEKTPSFTVTPDKGKYYCFGCGANGDVITFVMEYLKISFPEAMERLGANGHQLTDAERKAIYEEQKKRDAEIKRQDAQRSRKNREAALDIWNKTDIKVRANREYWTAEDHNKKSKIYGDVLIYLEHRNIDLEKIGGIPTTLRFDPDLFYNNQGVRGHYPAMVAAIMNKESKVVGVHRTYLDPNGPGKAQDLPNTKMTLGDVAGNFIPLSKFKKEVYLGEGIETCLSILEAMPNKSVQCVINIQNFAQVMLPDGVKSVVMCCDNDMKDPETLPRIKEKATKHFAAQGIALSFVVPPEGMDFNDWMGEIKKNGK